MDPLRGHVLKLGNIKCFVDYYESQFEDMVTTQSVTQDVTQDSNDGGSNVFVGGDYGEAESEENSGNY